MAFPILTFDFLKWIIDPQGELKYTVFMVIKTLGALPRKVNEKYMISNLFSSQSHYSIKLWTFSALLHKWSL